MPWVMVPVPEEAEKEFSEWLIRRTLEAALTAWPDGAMAEVVSQADPSMLEMLRHLASGSDMWASAAQVARVGDVAVDRLLDALAELNQYCMQRGWPAIVMVKQEGVPGEESQRLLMGGTVRTEVLRLVGA